MPSLRAGSSPKSSTSGCPVTQHAADVDAQGALAQHLLGRGPDLLLGEPAELLPGLPDVVDVEAVRRLAGRVEDQPVRRLVLPHREAAEDVLRQLDVDIARDHLTGDQHPYCHLSLSFTREA